MYQDLLVTISKCCKTDLGRITERSTDNDTMILHGGNRDGLWVPQDAKVLLTSLEKRNIIVRESQFCLKLKNSAARGDSSQRRC